MTSPVMNPAWGEARYRTAAATSPGWPMRLMLLSRMARSAIWSKVASSRSDGVSMSPGAMRVGGDSVAAEFLGHGLGEPDDAGLGRRVVRLARVSLPGAGRDGDDAAVALRPPSAAPTRGRTGTSRSGRRR